MNALNLSVDRCNYTRLKNAGFTLLELVLVLVLIAILISAAIFGYIGYERMTNNSAAKQNYVILMAAKIAYCQDHPGTTPAIADLGPFIGAGNTGGNTADLALSGVTPTLNIGACGAGANLTYGLVSSGPTGGGGGTTPSTLFGSGNGISCSNSVDSPVVNGTANNGQPVCTLQ